MWIIAGISLPAKGSEPVRLVVTLLDDPEAQVIGKIKYARMGWIVARSDGVDACSLHCDQIGAGILFVEHPTPNGVDFMPVHAPEDHPVAIDAENVAINLDVAKAQTHVHGF